LALAQQLVALNAALYPLVGGNDRNPSIQQSWDWLEGHGHQLTSACIAIAASCCICDGSVVRWDDGDAFRLTAAASLIFNCGEAALATQVAACSRMSLAPEPPKVDLLDQCSCAQLTAVSGVLRVLQDQTGAAAAFAASVAGPRALLGWLATLACVLQQVSQWRAGATGGLAGLSALPGADLLLCRVVGAGMQSPCNSGAMPAALGLVTLHSALPAQQTVASQCCRWPAGP
jgi:hypothetical protein